ncbi:unnamed protein product [Cladocopium goreaui]|nr:unnamed protein product [Cladocopium goreaui]|mmetsp:Transcript_74878/g.165360  ORF Transcript_74878/g.165360 Transcript_74878/m.165360 type:complete len:502 (-) Transcript_74878:272-1777(-)
MNVTSFRYIAFLVMNLQQVQATKDACKGTVDMLASAQEMLLLIAAFTVGWHLIGPCLGKLLKLLRHCRAVSCTRPTRSTPSAPNAGASSASSASSVDGADCTDTDSVQSSVAPRESKDGEGEGQRQQRQRNFPAELSVSAAASKGGLDSVRLNGADGNFQECALNNPSTCRLLRQAVQASEGPGASQLLALARRLLKKRDIHGAEKCLQNVSQYAPVDLRTRKLFIVACARSGNMDMGTQCLQQLQSDGFDGDFAIYSAIIRGFCNVGKVEEALTYLELMLQRKLQPDAMLFDILLEGCVSRNLFQKAERILNFMKDLGIQFSNTTLAACIKLYSARGEIKRAYVIFDEWVQTNRLQPNSEVYGALIAAALRNGRPEMALSTYETADCTPSTRTYEQLVQCCLQLGLLDKAVELLDEALGLKDAAPSRRAFIHPKIIEELLVLISRRKESERLAMPLLKRLESADFDLPENFDRYIKPNASITPLGSKRRADFDRWRSFLR